MKDSKNTKNILNDANLKELEEKYKSLKMNNCTGLSLPTILTLIFMTLKLCGVITWSWWWVLSPWLFSAGIVVLILIFAIVLLCVFKCKIQ